MVIRHELDPMQWEWCKRLMVEWLQVIDDPYERRRRERAVLAMSPGKERGNNRKFLTLLASRFGTCGPVSSLPSVLEIMDHDERQTNQFISASMLLAEEAPA